MGGGGKVMLMWQICGPAWHQWPPLLHVGASVCGGQGPPCCDLEGLWSCVRDCFMLAQQLRKAAC